MADGSKLPKAAQLKILRLEDAEQQAQTLISSTVRRIGELERIIMNNPDGDRGDAVREEIALLRERKDEHTDRHRSCCDVNAAIRRYLGMLPANAVLSDAKNIKVRPRGGESFVAAVDRVRRDIANLVSERFQVQQCGLPVEEIRAKARDWIARHAQTARPRITATHNEFAISFEVYDENASVPMPDIAAIMAFLYPEKLTKRIDEAIEQMPKPRLSLSAEQKGKRLREIKDLLYERETEEEALISLAEEQGQTIDRRPTADPRAILGLVVDRNRATAA
ncbi:hypothetical protein GA0061098_1015111 [Bradyrhizobium shewense]|uniref:Uncharacterized protein n=1 Tax=Bradyrhizobium shewense TaxID=1761772 RepID=A0A1C3XG87_9BRAD|nr:hypothetical protein [Bradyrhizobium shewense]SCB51229.1 hypothetical protein GA0061098_1015111 [Bradyrhizobium shewense]